MHPYQIRIPCNDHIRPPVQRHFQELVVFRISALARTISGTGTAGRRQAIIANTGFQCYTEFLSYTNRLRNVTVTLEEDVAQWARIEAARRDTSVSRLLGELLKERMGKLAGKSAAADAAERLATFGKRHKLSLRGLKIKDLINEGRR